MEMSKVASVVSSSSRASRVSVSSVSFALIAALVTACSSTSTEGDARGLRVHGSVTPSVACTEYSPYGGAVPRDEVSNALVACGCTPEPELVSHKADGVTWKGIHCDAIDDCVRGVVAAHVDAPWFASIPTCAGMPLGVALWDPKDCPSCTVTE